MAKREVKPTEQDTHPPRTDMEKLEAIRKIFDRVWYLDDMEYTQKFRLANYNVIYREIDCILKDREVDESFYSVANSYS